MKRRTFLQAGFMAAVGWQYAAPLRAAFNPDRLEEAAEALTKACAGQVKGASLCALQGSERFSRGFGTARGPDAMFLLGSISKPINVTALMTLYDQGQFALEDPVRKFLPEFTGDGRETVLMKHLLSHASGLPDQVPENNGLRKAHAPLSEFVAHAVRQPLAFLPGTQYQYSSMGILLATNIAEKISGTDIATLVDRAVFQPLGMRRSAQGLGRFTQADMMPAQTEFGAVESGGGDPSTKDWDWNSSYWRALGAPWGGTHCSAPDVASWLSELLLEKGVVVRPETARLMKKNHNLPGLTPRGLGLNVGLEAGSPGCSIETFGHTGSTGTICWADPVRETICVVLTTLPARAVTPHPRNLAAEKIALAMRG